MNRKLFKKENLNIIIIILFIATPLLSAILFCLKDGRTISDIYIPLGGWSDEITYYKQIEGILSHGLPRGYFGYNQSRALYGSLAVWGIIPLIPYVVWGFFFGWNYCSPIYANIFFCMFALWGLYMLLRPKKIWMGIISLFWVTNQFLNRYVLSGVIEASVIMQLILVVACGEYLLSEKIRGQQGRIFSPAKDKLVLIFCTILICFLTLARPYFGVLFLIPFWKVIKEKQKTWVIGLPLLAIAVMILFFINNHYFCSVYFKNIFSLETMQSATVTDILRQVFDSFVEIARQIWYAMRYKGSGMGWYYLLLAIELLIMLCTCIYRKYRHREVPPMFIITLMGNSLILLSIIIMYDLGVGARHILSLITVNAALLIIEVSVTWGTVWGSLLSVVCVFSIIQTQGADALPYKNDTYVEYMNTLEKEFAQVVHVSDGISYDNVVAMPTADHEAQNPEISVCTYYGLMFAMPSGVGISLDFEDFYDDPANLKAGYILVHPKGKIRKTIESIGMHCIYENEEFALYSR